MKKWKIGISVLSFFLILYIPYMVQGVGVDAIIEETNGVTAPFGFHLSETMKSILAGEFSFSFETLLGRVADFFVGEGKKQFPQILKITAAGLLSGVMVRLPDGERHIGGLACALLLSLMALTDFSAAQALVLETMDSMSLFLQGMLPAVSASAIASGSTIRTVGMFGAIQLLMQILRHVMLPLSVVITVFSVTDSFGEISYLKGMVSFLKQMFKWGTGLLLLLYGAVIGMESAGHAVFDGLTGKTVKYAVSSLVPVVGSALSESLETVTAGAKAIRGALGVGGIAGVCLVALLPLVRLTVLAFAYKGASVLISLGGDEKSVVSVAEIGNGMFRLLGVLLSVCVMFVISIAMLCFMGGAT